MAVSGEEAARIKSCQEQAKRDREREEVRRSTRARLAASQKSLIDHGPART